MHQTKTSRPARAIALGVGLAVAFVGQPVQAGDVAAPGTAAPAPDKPATKPASAKPASPGTQPAQPGGAAKAKPGTAAPVQPDPLGPEATEPVPGEGDLAEPTEPTPEPPLPIGTGVDEILLRDGGIVRGVVVDEAPESHVTIVVGGTGEIRRYEWEQVENVERNKYEEQHREPTVLTLARPKVHIELFGRGDPVSLYELELRGGDREFGEGGRDRLEIEVCRSPCDVAIDASAGQDFAIGTPGIPRSRPFPLINRGKEFTIEVRPGRRPLYIAGWVLTAIGGAALIGGAATMLTADTDKSVRAIGGYTMLGSAVFIGAGIAMILNGRTRVWLPGDRKPKRRRKG